MQINNTNNLQNNETDDEKLKLHHFIGIGLLAFVYTVERMQYRWKDFLQETKEKIKTRLRLQKELIVNPKEIKEKTFNLKYYNQKITNNIVDKFLVLNEESVDSNLIKEIMIYSLHNKYKDDEVINKAFCVPDFCVDNMLDNYAFICIKNKDLAINLLKKEQFTSKLQESDMTYELLLKPLRRKSYDVVNQILNDEDLLNKVIHNPKKILKAFLNQLDSQLPEEIIKKIEEKNIFSDELIKQEYFERKNIQSVLFEMGKNVNSQFSDLWLKTQMSRIEYERYNQKYPEKNTKTKVKKI